jgi:hypothetical protein
MAPKRKSQMIAELSLLQILAATDEADAEDLAVVNSSVSPSRFPR